MARIPVSVFKRPTTKKNKFRWYIQIWEPERGAYSTARSAFSLARDLELDPEAFPPTSRAGALLIGMEASKRGGIVRRAETPFLADYCARFWDWDTSECVQSKLARGQRIGKEYVKHNASYIRNYVRTAFPTLRLSELKTYMLEDFTLRLKRESGLSNRSINAVLMAVTIPLREAARLGHIHQNPALNVLQLGNAGKERGIPTESEMRDLFKLPGLDSRVRCAILLGAVYGLRLGEILALRLQDIGESRLTVRHSWSKEEGIKSTKTNSIREFHLLPSIQSALLQLAESNPHDSQKFLFYGNLPDKPFDFRALEREFYKALKKIGIQEQERSQRNITFHSLRHWCNAMLRGNLPDSKLRLLTGHATQQMTDHYDHATETDLQEINAAVEKRILPLLRDR